MLGGDIMETQVDDELSRLVADLGIEYQKAVELFNVRLRLR